MTTKAELKATIEATGATVKLIRQDGDSFKVSIGWRDYLKVKHLAGDKVQFSLIISTNGAQRQ